jgi:E3 ubiquitin-protein ligase mind-bomb
MICGECKRDTLLKPCNHIIGCNACTERCKKCLICKAQIQERIKVDECLICSDRKSSILLEPCGHMVTCDVCSKLIKKCIKCREQIEKKTTYFDCCNEKVHESLQTSSLSTASLTSSSSFCKKSMNEEENEEGLKDMRKLQQQLHEIKEHVSC